MLEKVKEKLNTDNQMLKQISEYLIERCNREPELIEKVLNEKKSLEQCSAYIDQEARKYLNSRNGYIAKEIVFGWVVHYFDEENIKFDTQPSKTITKTSDSKPKTTSRPIKRKEKQTAQSQQLSLF